jgi:hypothetical protein
MTASTGKYRLRGTGSIALGYLKRTKNGEGKFEHVATAERVLGKPLPIGAVVHHVNEDKLDNRPSNLVICPGQGYHRIIHRRMAALAACGHASWRKCWICGVHDDLLNLYISPNGANIHHRQCAIRRNKEIKK